MTSRITTETRQESTNVLTQTEQIMLNSRAIARDIRRYHFSRILFHVKGLIRAIIKN